MTCLVDTFRPSVGLSALQVLEAAGCSVVVPEGQTCCGQPADNSGDVATARAVARGLIRAFEDCDYVVAPSGSCASTLRHRYPVLLADDPALAEPARALAGKTHELTCFLADVLDHVPAGMAWPGVAVYHDSCAGLRELGIKAQPRRLLAAVEGLTVLDAAEPEECCGFGGTFAVKYPEVSTRMVEAKASDLEATGADLVLGGDLGCLLNIAGRLRRRGGRPMEVRHVAEVLAGARHVPPIGAPGEGAGR